MPAPRKRWYLWRKKKAQTLNNQAQCPLFGKLPAEVRQLIWREVLHDKLLHVVSLRKQIFVIECPDPRYQWPNLAPQLPWFFDQVDWMMEGSHSRSWPAGHERPVNLLAVLMTCRRMYLENVENLYAKNLFAFSDIHTVIYLSGSLLPQRLDTIKRLRLEWTIKHHSQKGGCQRPRPRYIEPVWDEACAVFARMGGLRDLSLSLYGFVTMHPKSVGEIMEQVFEPLYAIRQAPSFYVFIQANFEIVQTTARLDHAPFRYIMTGFGEQSRCYY